MEHQCGKCGAWCIPVCPDCEDELHTSLRARVAELEDDRQQAINVLLPAKGALSVDAALIILNR